MIWGNNKKPKKEDYRHALQEGYIFKKTQRGRKNFETNNTSNISAWKTLHCLLTVLKAILKWLSRCAKRTVASSG